MPFKITGNGMPSGSENSLIEQIKFNFAAANISNADVNLLNYNNSTVWARAYNILPYSGDTTGLDVSTIKATVFTNECTDTTTNRNIISGNSLAYSGVNSKVYFGDMVDISASAAKGYKSPSINDIDSVSSDVNLTNYITPGGVMTIYAPELSDGSDTITYTPGYSKTVGIKNPNSVEVFVKYQIAEQKKIGSVYTWMIQANGWHDIGYLSAYGTTSFTLSSNEVPDDDESGEKALALKAIYGAASGSEYYELVLYTYTGGGGHGCLTSDTPILLEDMTEKQLSDINIGDIISGFTIDGKIIKNKVLNKYFASVEYTYKIILDNNMHISVTGNHPILCGEEYRNVEGIDGYNKLNVNDIITTIHGLNKIIQIEKINKYEKVYNLYTELDNFIANGVIVACENPDKFIIGVNCFETPEGMGKDLCVSADSEIMMPDGQSMKAKDIHDGDIILTYNEDKKLVPTKVINKYYADAPCVYKIVLSNNQTLTASDTHPILCGNTYKNIAGVDGYEKLNIGDLVSTTNGEFAIIDIIWINIPQRVYNFYTGTDNFIANGVIVACENPDKFIMGVNCFETPEGRDKWACVSGDTKILSENYETICAKDIHKDDIILTYNEDKKLVPTKVINKYYTHTDIVYDIVLVSGEKLTVSEDHPILCGDVYKNIAGVHGYDKLNINDKITTINGNIAICDIAVINIPQRVYNFYTGTDNFIANGVIVACENPDNLIIGVNCFETSEGVIKGGGPVITTTTNINMTGGSSTTGGVGCLSANTEILLDDQTNSKKISELHKNDSVLSFDHNGELSSAKVLNKYYADVEYIYDILLTNGIHISVTGNHPILCGNEYRNVEGIDGYSKLNINDYITMFDKTNISIKKITKVDIPQRVYNLYTETDNFIANGVVVACENPDKFIIGVNCFETPEGMAKNYNTGTSGGTSTTF